MKILIHDLSEQDFLQLGIDVSGYKVINANTASAPCTGCYNCWLKTPGICKANDWLRNSKIGVSEETVVISRNCYGGYSEQIKKVFDRGIPASLPFFTYRSWKIRHVRRYGVKRDQLTVIFYGDFLETERKTIRLITEANRSNMDFKKVNLFMLNDIMEIGQVLK